MIVMSVLDLYVGRGCGWAVAVSHVSRNHSAVQPSAHWVAHTVCDIEKDDKCLCKLYNMLGVI